MIVQRQGPLLTRDDIPDVADLVVDATSVFNPGAVARDDGGADLLLRVQTRGRHTFFMPALHAAGGSVTVEARTTDLHGLPPNLVAHHIYDPRLTRLDDQLLAVTAIDTDRGCRLAVWNADDLGRLDFVGFTGDHDTRNGVLFPRKVGGRYLMLERPNLLRPDGGPPTGSGVTLLSADTVDGPWRTEGPVFDGRPGRWDELVGAGPPPVLTHRGWLLVYHGIATHFGAASIYQAGCVLLDAEDPSRVLARGRDNILEPRLGWEMTGQVPNVVFPSGLTMAEDGTVRIYYGAADTCVGCGLTTLDQLLAACDGPGATP